MKIVLKKLELTNFGSWRHVVLPLEQRGLVLVQGKTGAGKSTLFKALFWVLYGESPDSAAADEVVNDAVGKNTAVSLELLIGSDEYKIIRYRKHAEWKNKVVVWSKGQVLGEKDSKVDVLNKLIVRLLGIDRETFLKTVYFLQRDGARFPALTDAQQKQLIETITDLAVLPYAERLTRDKLHTAQKMFTQLTERCARYEEAERGLQTVLATSRDATANELDTLTRALKEARVVATRADAEASKRDAAMKVLAERQSDVQREMDRDRYELHRVAKQREFIETSAPECPTCGSALDPQRRDALWKHLNQQHTLLETSLDALTQEAKQLRRAVQEQRTGGSEDEAKARVVLLERQIKQIQATPPSVDEIQKELDAVLRRAAASRRVKANVERFVERLEFWVKGFGRTGLRTILLPQVLNELTKRTNGYLATFADLTLRVQYVLDEGRIGQAYQVSDEAKWKSYATLSGGERQLVDLCTSFALRELAESSRTQVMDCVLLDEPLEGLDARLAQQLPQLLTQVEKSSVFIISHSDQLAPYFPTRMTIRKSGHFSTVDEGV